MITTPVLTLPGHVCGGVVCGLRELGGEMKMGGAWKYSSVGAVAGENRKFAAR